MRRALTILADMTDGDLAWLVQNGELHDHAVGKALIHAGQRVETLYVLLDGEVEIVTPEGIAVARAGVGEVLGEMSLIEDLRPSVVVHTLTPVRALAISHRALQERMTEDPAFAARLYKALATFLSTRLRSHMSRLGFGAPVPEMVNTGALPARDGRTTEERVARLEHFIEEARA